MLRGSLLGATLATLIAITPVLAQRGGHRGSGGVVIRGGGHTNIGVRVGFGAPRVGARFGYAPQRFIGVPVIAPFGYYSYDSYYSGITPYAAQTPVVVVQQPPAPVYVNPPMSYAVAPPPQPQTPPVPPSPMLVFKDRTVYSVSDYWMANGQLYFLPSRGTQKVVPLDTLDLDMTQKVNEACNIPFELKNR